MEEKICIKCGFQGEPTYFKPKKNLCKNCRNAARREAYNEHKIVFRAKRNKAEMVARLSNNKKLKGWGDNKSRDFLYDYNKDRTDGSRDTRIDHKNFVGNIVVLPAKSNRHRRAE